MIFIGGWGMKFIFFRIFSIFLTQTVKNGQICIQTIKFQFKQTNQESPHHYRPSAPAACGSAGTNRGTRSGCHIVHGG
jgi:hypothetical protein